MGSSSARMAGTSSSSGTTGVPASGTSGISSSVPAGMVSSPAGTEGTPSSTEEVGISSVGSTGATSSMGMGGTSASEWISSSASAVAGNIASDRQRATKMERNLFFIICCPHFVGFGVSLGIRHGLPLASCSAPGIFPSRHSFATYCCLRPHLSAASLVPI